MGHGIWRGIDLDALSAEERAPLLEAKRLSEFKAANPRRIVRAQSAQKSLATATEPPIDEIVKYRLVLCNRNNDFGFIFKVSGMLGLEDHKRKIESQYHRWNLPEVAKEREKRLELERRETWLVPPELSEFERKKRSIGVVV